MANYYNEFEPYAAQWLRNLIANGLIPNGEVDTRSIVDVQAEDLKGFTQCHFFAGIGGWPLALGMAGWSDERPVWTGSCPCQPFSRSGKGKAQSDERHLWPHWYRLIKQSKPSIIFGEQVERAITCGWWDDAAADLEKEEYACASAILPAFSVGAYHRRDRLFFVAHSSIKDDRGSLSESSPRQISQFGSYILSNDDTDGERKRVGWPLPTPEIPLLVDGYPGLMDEYVALGNAIVPQAASEFIRAYREVLE